MSVLLVLVAHDGRTLQLDVQGQTRIDAVQQALVSVTGISVADQIIMCHGARLDPAKPLAAYKLPVADPAAAEDQPVFLYHKAYLRPGAAPPPVEPLPILDVTVPGLPSVGLRHPLHSAHSPLIRALPDYEAQFQQQLGEARAYWEASQQRLHKCRQLMSEQEVQARAADAARANVETHYNYIASIYSSFVDKYVVQHRQHSQLLSQFASLSAAMESIELPQQLATAQWRVLADLQPHRGKLQEWHDSCTRSHEHFASKVAELESVFQLLRQEVERLFLQAPSVDLDALGLQLNEAEGLIDEQGSILQVLSKDLLTVRQLVEDVVAQLGGSVGGASLSGAAVHDTCAAVDTMHDNHLHSLLPRVRACDASTAEFVLRCADAKGRMTKDVLLQLQGIAAQQSRIRDMKHKLAVFNEVLARQAAAFAELQTATRLPAAYRLALAECARRAAWQEMFAGQANRLAEHCGRITAKEASKRETVRRQLERYLPVDLLARAGLLQEPPHCTVSVPPTESFLLPVSPADLAHLPAAIQQAADSAAQPTAAAAGEAASSSSSSSSRPSAAVAARRRSSGDGGEGQQLPPQMPSPRSAAVGTSSSRTAATGATTPSAAAASTLGMSAWLSPPKAAAPAVGPAAGSDFASNTALENARLRAELAAVLAQQAARELGDDLLPVNSSGGGGVARSVVGASMLASTAAGGPAGIGSISLAASAAVAAAQHPAAAVTAAPEVSGPAGKPYGHGGPAVVPASVAAPLPSVTAALQQVAQEQQESAAAVVNRQAMALGPVQAALAAKDELVAGLESRCKRLAADVASYEARISQLEAQLAARFSSSMQLPQQQQEQQQQQQGDRQAETEGDGSSREPHAAAASGPMVQSVVPAFALDATQHASCFFGTAESGVADRLRLPLPQGQHPATWVASEDRSGTPTMSAVVLDQGQSVPKVLSDLADEAVQAAAGAASVTQGAPDDKSQMVQTADQDSAVCDAAAPAQEPSQQQVPASEQQQLADVDECSQQQQQQHEEGSQLDEQHEQQQAAAGAYVEQQQPLQRGEYAQEQHVVAAQSESFNEPRQIEQQQEAAEAEEQQQVQILQAEQQRQSVLHFEPQPVHQDPTYGSLQQEQQQGQVTGDLGAGQPVREQQLQQRESDQQREQQQEEVPATGMRVNQVQQLLQPEACDRQQQEEEEQQQQQQQRHHAGQQLQVDDEERAGGDGEQHAAEDAANEECGQLVEASTAPEDGAPASDFNNSSSRSSGGSRREMPPSVASVEVPLPAVTVPAAAASGSLSVSEPDLRAVMVAQPADVEAHQQQTAAAAAAALRRPTRSSSAEPAAGPVAALPVPRQGGRHSADGSLIPAAAAAGPMGTGGLSSLLSSSMHFLFHRTSSRGDSSSSNSNASPVVSPAAVSPAMSPPARSSPVAAAAAAAAAADQEYAATARTSADEEVIGAAVTVVTGPVSIPEQ